MDNETLTIILVLVALPVYLAPSIIAFRRHRANRYPIAVLNVVFGWTGWGWVGTLLWACFDNVFDKK